MVVVWKQNERVVRRFKDDPFEFFRKLTSDFFQIVREIKPCYYLFIIMHIRNYADPN
jgi:hypothetical protein